jgi:sphinganine-1-phosphate aldolase
VNSVPLDWQGGDIGNPLSPWTAEGSDGPTRPEIPEDGRAWSEVRSELIARKRQDYDWRAGRLPLYVYHESEELTAVAREAYSLYFSENALGLRAFPSLAGMEQEVVASALSLFSAPQGATGSFTSGGTESLFLALKSARDAFKSRRPNILRPRLVLPRTAHPALDKAGQYLELDVVRVPVGADFRADVSEMARAVDARTMLIVGSAPCYPYGVFDPIAALAQLATSQGVGLHVDACLGGFLAPFAKVEGYPIPPFDFCVPGVSSLSADLHKFGFAARGASVILYRSATLQKHQGFAMDDWPRGSYSTQTFLGSRPGGPIASAWAVTRHLGKAGYRRLARTIMETKRRLVLGLEHIPGLQVLRPSELNIVAYRSVDIGLDIDAVADGLCERGWFVGRLREPRAIHFALNPVHAPVIDDYLRDLALVVEAVRRSGRVGRREDATY